MTANVNVEIARRSNVLRVPNAALRFRPTNEMFAALGQTPPDPAQLRADGGGRGGGQEQSSRRPRLRQRPHRGLSRHRRSAAPALPHMRRPTRRVATDKTRQHDAQSEPRGAPTASGAAARGEGGWNGGRRRAEDAADPAAVVVAAATTDRRRSVRRAPAEHDAGRARAARCSGCARAVSIRRRRGGNGRRAARHGRGARPRRPHADCSGRARRRDDHRRALRSPAAASKRAGARGSTSTSS